MLKKLYLFFLVAISYNLCAQTEQLNNKIIVDSLFSDKINDYRTIKIFLPDDYSEDTKYPVIYTLDGDWMFSPLVNQSKVLMDFDVIPKSIIVGIFHGHYKKRNSDLSWKWDTGELTESSSNFSDFLTNEIVSYIDNKFSSTGFNTLVGHSNSATFSHIILTKKNQQFNGFIALSQDISDSQLEKYVEFSMEKPKSDTFYFVASANNDESNRIQSANRLDSIFKSKNMPNIHTKHLLYDAGHNSVVAKGLKDGLEFVFSFYKHYTGQGANLTLIDSLHQNNIDIIQFVDNNVSKIRKVYGLQTKVALNDFDTYFLSIASRNKQELIDVLNYHKEKLGVDEWFYYSYAQLFEYKGFYEESLKYWLKNLDNNYERDREDIFCKLPQKQNCLKVE